MTRNILVTGFAPFDGRTVNGSWIAARSLAAKPGVTTIEIPVAWGAPAAVLGPVCSRECPEIIIGMGEGREGGFRIETVARNTRKERADNHGNMPKGVPISADGPAVRYASFDAKGLLHQLQQHDYPTEVSLDAGGFLCEELLYTLESLKVQHSNLSTVVFIHLPPHGTVYRHRDIDVTATDETLATFAATLFDAVMNLVDLGALRHRLE